MQRTLLLTLFEVMRCQRLYELKMVIFERDSKKVALRQERHIDTLQYYRRIIETGPRTPSRWGGCGHSIVDPH